MITLILTICVVGFIGGSVYTGWEVGFDNTSHRVMILIGAIAFVTGGLLGQTNLPNIAIYVLMMLTTTIYEYIGGKMFNHDYAIWNYKKMPLNYQGQICVPFILIWFFFGPFIVWFYDLLMSADYIDLINRYISMFS